MNEFCSREVGPCIGEPGLGSCTEGQGPIQKGVFSEGVLHAEVQCILAKGHRGPPWIDRHDLKDYLPVT